jgi:hypothetical protein
MAGQTLGSESVPAVSASGSRQQDGQLRLILGGAAIVAAVLAVWGWTAVLMM